MKSHKCRQGSTQNSAAVAPGVNESLIRITYACNQNCLFCNTYGMKGNMSVSDVFRQCKELERDKVVPVFTGGEPTLHKDLLTMIRILREMGFPLIGIQTNAMRLSDKRFAASVSRAGANIAIVSLHSHIACKSDKITQTPGAFALTCAGIENMLELGMDIVINHVLNAENYRDAARFVRFLHENLIRAFDNLPGRITALSLSYVQPYGRVFNNMDIVPAFSVAASYYAKALQICAQRNISVVNPGCGIPVCFTPGHESISSEAFLLSNEITDVRTIDVNRAEKVKGPNCARCAYDNTCFGVWARYAEIHGLDELKPVEVRREASVPRRKKGKEQ